MNKNNKNQGQILLITVMLLATALTVALSVSFKSTTDTQITKLEEESQKALAAAEAGIEAGLKGSSGFYSAINTLSGLSGSGISLTDSTVDCVNIEPDTFVSPLIRKDEQYTFYLADYEDNYANSYTDVLNIDYGTSSCANIALELTLISNASPYTVTRYKSDFNNILAGTNGLTTTETTNTLTVNGITTSFGCATQLDLSSGGIINPKILIVRFLSINASDTTNLGFQTSSGTLPLAGKSCTSEAKTNSGVTKTVKLFQSYPQIPAEFFVTSF